MASVLDSSPKTERIKKEERKKKRGKKIGCLLQIEREISTSSFSSFFPSQTVTGNFAKVIHGLNANQLTDQVIQRSKRMILDTLGVGLLGTSTEVFHKVAQYSKVSCLAFMAHPKV